MTINNKFKLISFDELDSTNSEAIRIAVRDKPDRDYIILAKSQTKARGRSGKGWQSTSGNLHASLLMKPNKDLELLPQLSFVTALAVYNSVEFVLLDSCLRGNDIKIQLKWPNDVLVNGRKISGILLESVKVEEEYYLIIGIGINVTYHPDNIDQPTTSLAKENISAITLHNLLELLIENFEKYYQIWEKEGFSTIRKIWLEHAYKLHENITVKHQNEIIFGIFKDIDLLGRIILQLPSKKIISFSTVDLSF